MVHGSSTDGNTIDGDEDDEGDRSPSSMDGIACSIHAIGLP